ETARQQGEPPEEPLALPSSRVSRPGGIPIPGEDGVEQGIKNIYQAIHRQPYPTAGIEPDKATLNSLQCRCPYHPQNDCPIDCSYALQWLKSVRKLLPKDYRGGSMEVPVSNDLLDTRRHAQAFREEEYGDVRQNDHGDEIIVNDQRSALLFEEFEDHMY